MHIFANTGENGTIRVEIEETDTMDQISQKTNATLILFLMKKNGGRLPSNDCSLDRTDDGVTGIPWPKCNSMTIPPPVASNDDLPYIPSRGLVNYRENCHYNTTLQCLSRTRALRRALKNFVTSFDGPSLLQVFALTLFSKSLQDSFWSP